MTESVKIANGKPETRAALNKFKADYNVEHPGDQLRTLGDAIDKLIEEVHRLTPELEQKTLWYTRQKERVSELEGILGACQQMCDEREKRIQKLEEEIKKLKGEC